jgi:hypothetical protein
MFKVKFFVKQCAITHNKIIENVMKFTNIIYGIMETCYLEDIMKKKLLLCLIGLMLFYLNNLSAQMTKTQLQDMYTTYLKEQGYQPEIDSDGDVVFKTEGRNFWIDIDDRDLQSFRIVFSNFWEIESLAEKTKVYEAANYINRTTKVVKVFINSREDNVSMDANIFIDKPENFKIHFRRMVDLLISEIWEFKDKMNE